jgi:integrase
LRYLALFAASCWTLVWTQVTLARISSAVAVQVNGLALAFLSAAAGLGYLWELVRRLAREAAVEAWQELSPHSLRHSAITFALDAGATLRDVQDYAGHKDPRTTRRSARARPGQPGPQRRLRRRSVPGITDREDVDKCFRPCLPGFEVVRA